MISIIFNTHRNKMQGVKVDAMMRVMGSVAWANAVRSGDIFSGERRGPERAPVPADENNLGAETKVAAYRILKTDALARVEWLGPADTMADRRPTRQPHQGRQERPLPKSLRMAHRAASAKVGLESNALFARGNRGHPAVLYEAKAS